MTKKIILAITLSLFLSACNKKVQNFITPPSPTPEKSGVTIIPIQSNLAQATLVDLTTKTKIAFSAPVAIDNGYQIEATNIADPQSKIATYFDQFQFTNNGSGQYSQADLTCTVFQTPQDDTFDVTVTCRLD